MRSAVAKGLIEKAVGLRYCAGMLAVEYALALLVFIGMMTFAAEFYRVSMYDQAIARATYQGTLAASTAPGDCVAAFMAAFENEPTARWLLDRNDDGVLDFVFNGDPEDAEVNIVITADDGVVGNGVAFDTLSCGNPGSWISARAFVSYRSTFGFGRILRGTEAWAVAQ